MAKVTCPHCGTVGSGAGMKRWHFDNCRNKPGEPDESGSPPGLARAQADPKPFTALDLAGEQVLAVNVSTKVFITANERKVYPGAEVWLDEMEFEGNRGALDYAR